MPTPTATTTGTFDWLEGATGVRLVVGHGDARRTVRVAGDIDQASLEPIESAVREAFRCRPEQVELDLRDVSFIEPAGNEMLDRLARCARERQISFIVTRGPGTPAAIRPAVAAECTEDGVRRNRASRVQPRPPASASASAGRSSEPAAPRGATPERRCS